MKCVIPCAGESSRMSYVPKGLLKLGDKPVLAHVIDMWKDSVDSFVFVLRRSSSYLWEYLPENSIVVFQDEPRGLADAILRAEKCIGDKFIIALGDCLQIGTFNFAEAFPIELGIGVWEAGSEEELKKSYSVVVDSGLVKEVVEKPTLGLHWKNCGMGTYFMDTRIFDYIRKTKVKPGGGDFTEVLQAMIDNGEPIYPVYFKGKYINISSPEDLGKAEEVIS